MKKQARRPQSRWTQFRIGQALLCLCLVLVLFGSIQAAAGRHCGAEGDWRSALIPDVWPPPETKRQFQALYGEIRTVPVSRACIRHDTCYAKPGASREDCDQQFLQDMRAECARVYSGILEIPLREACHLAAQSYYQAVRKHGAQAFQKARPVASTQSQASAHAQEITSSQHAVQSTQTTQAVQSAPSNWVFEFKPIEVYDRIYNGVLKEFEVFLTLYEDSPAYLVRIADVGTGLIMPQKEGFYRADAAEPVGFGSGLRLDIRTITTIPNSGLEILSGEASQRIGVWWGNNRLAFSVSADAGETLQSASVSTEPATDLLFVNSDFEAGDLTNWTATGQAFAYQPTKGDNPTARHRNQPSKHQGNFWIGTFEKYRGGAGERPGSSQGDRPKGTLRSIQFHIQGPQIGFLIGGGRNTTSLYAALEVDGQQVRKQTGSNSESMKRVLWDVQEFMGQSAQIVIQDGSDKGWGHINVDDFRYMNAQE